MMEKSHAEGSFSATEEETSPHAPHQHLEDSS